MFVFSSCRVSDIAKILFEPINRSLSFDKVFQHVQVEPIKKFEISNAKKIQNTILVNENRVSKTKFCGYQDFFLYFDFKNGCLNELKDDTEKS